MSDEQRTAPPSTSTQPSTGENGTPAKKAWGEPLFRLDKAWMTLEQTLCVWVIVAEIAVLCLWVSLTGLSAHYAPGGNASGVVYRSIVTALFLGTVTHLVLRPKGTEVGDAAHRRNVVHQSLVTAAVIAGLFLGRSWANAGSEYASNFRAWIQNASALALVGGLRGVVTRLTLWLALLGASIATSKGKHINIDVATRFIPKRYAGPVAIVGWVAAALVCFTATWGFVDGIAVTKFRAEAFTACTASQGDGAGHLCDTPVGDRLATAKKGMATDLFLLGRQVSLDLRSFPKVLAGEPYDRWLKGAEWNEWLKGADWAAYFTKEGAEGLVAPESSLQDTRMPLVSAPGASGATGLLIRDLNFILPFGLLVIGIKFVIRILLVLSGHVRVDLDSAHGDDEAKHMEHHDAADDLGVSKEASS